MKAKAEGWVLAVVAGVVSACAGSGGAQPQLVVGALHVRSIDDAGYNQTQHRT